MVPLFSRRSILVLSLGFILGVLGGFSYWQVSPIEFQVGWPPIKGLTDSPPTVYESIAKIEPVARGAASTSTKTLQRRAEYWSYRLQTSFFYEFLSQELAEQFPEYSHSTEELALMITARVKYVEGSAVELKVTGQSKEEVTLLAAMVPELFRDYLIAEEMAEREKEYQNALEQLDKVLADLIQPSSELDSLEAQIEAERSDLEAASVVANAEIAALQLELDGLSAKLTALITEGIAGPQYDDTLTQIASVSASLAEARIELHSLEGQIRYPEESPEYIVAYAKVDALLKELRSLASYVASPPVPDAVEEEVYGLFVTREPSAPAIVPLERIRGRNALMLGAVLGVGIAWLGLNFRWLVRRRSSSHVVTSTWEEEDEDMEDEA